MEPNEKPLTRTEASLIARWLQDKGKPTKQGWVSLWKLSPAQVSETYQETEQDILIAARRIQVTEEAK